MIKTTKALGCESCKYVLKVNLRAGNPCCGKHEWPGIEERPEKDTGIYVPYKCNDHAPAGADRMTTKEIKTQVANYGGYVTTEGGIK